MVSARRLIATVLLLAPAPAWAQTESVEKRPEALVELVLAETEHQARVVARAMKTDFFVDQLLIPQTHYIDRLPWSKLQPSVQRVLENAEPGEPYLLTGATGKHLVARLLPDGPPAILGDTEYAQSSDAIWAVLSVGPTDLRALSLEVDVEAQDLAAICESKNRLLDERLRTAREKLSALSADAPFPHVVQAHASLTSALSLAGDMAAAIQTVHALGNRLQEQGVAPEAEPDHRDIIDQYLGILELRRGEVENCVDHHNREMCLFPLSKAARHRVGDGARRAFEHFTRLLKRDPDDLDARWLLNVAAMTIGSYPEGVPERFRIGPEAFASPVDLGRFWDVAASAGVAYSDNAGGSVADDFDGDGLVDLAVSSRDPCEPLRLYRNEGNGSFADVTEVAGLSSQFGGLNVTQLDYDNDGRLDLYVMRGGWETAIRDSLLRNRATPTGGVVFEDVTASAGLGGPAHRTHSAAWADYDGDGWLDLFLGHELSFSRLLRNRGNGTFEDTTLRAGMRFRSLTKGATWGDVDNDGRPDLYVSNYGDRNLLFINRGGGRFDEVGRERGVEKPTYSFTTWFWDYDNDGWQDLLVVTLLQSVDEVAREYLGLLPQGETLRIYRNRGDGSFEDVTEAVGMKRMIPTMGANFGDLDNDGYLDVYLGTGAPSYGMLVPNRMFWNRQGREFVDVTTSTGTGHLQKGHGVAFADFDNDGDQDIFSNMGGAFPGDKYASALFENPGHGNDWLTIELVGTRSNRAAIGARIRVLVEVDGRQEQRVRWVTSGGSFGASPLAQHIGLGREARVARVEIDWPSKRGSDAMVRQVLDDVPINSHIVVTEQTFGFEVAPRSRFTFAPGAAGAHPAHETR